MDSSSQTNRATDTTAATTITSITIISASTGRPATDAHHNTCWCGQVMDTVHGDHCPRCGTTRAARAGAVLARLAA